MQLLTIADILNQPIEETNQLIVKAQELSNVCATVLNMDKGDGHLRAPGIHASEISGCQRKVVYSLLGTERKDQAAPIWRARFKIGHAIHAMLQRDFKLVAGLTDKMPIAGWHITFEEEASIAPGLQKLAKKWDIHSHCDGVFVVRERWDGPALLRILLEIKSAAPDVYAKIRRPELDHIEQGHVYMACLDTPLIWFLYYNKGNQNFTNTDPTFLVKFDPRIWKGLEDRFEEAHDWAARNTLPPRQESVKCEFCPFAWTCAPPSLAARQSTLYRPAWQPVRGP